jgi:hypothetical protein
MMQTTLARNIGATSLTDARVPDYLEGAARDFGAALRDLARPWSDFYNVWLDAIRAKPWPPDQHLADCRCPRCCPDDCHCRCCVAGADLLVRTRVGERRVVPIVIENHWRREREVELELNRWSSSSGDQIKVTGEIVPPAKFVLKPCEEKTAILTVTVLAENATKDARGETTERVPPDLRDCAVFYADLRIIGCDVRPIRIALAVLPRDCDAFRIDCRCVCC